MDNTAHELDLGNLNHDSAIILRKNNGYDFGSWTNCLKNLNDWQQANRLFLINDSMFLLPDLLPAFLTKALYPWQDVATAARPLASLWLPEALAGN